MADGRAPLQVGTLAYDELLGLVRAGAIAGSVAIEPPQIQPASIDLTLGEEVYRMPGSILPLEHERVGDLVRGLALERIDLSETRCLAREQVYAVRLRESFRLPPALSGYTNSKSSAGRVDVTTRTMADGGTRYDRIPPGYSGELWIELIPRSFNVLARAGVSLNQAIFFEGRHVLGNQELLERYQRAPLLFVEPEDSPAPEKQVQDGRVVMTSDLGTEIVGHVAKRTHEPLDLLGVGSHDPEDFFVPIPRPRQGLRTIQATLEAAAPRRRPRSGRKALLIRAQPRQEPREGLITPKRVRRGRGTGRGPRGERVRGGAEWQAAGRGDLDAVA